MKTCILCKRPLTFLFFLPLVLIWCLLFFSPQIEDEDDLDSKDQFDDDEEEEEEEECDE